MKLQPRQQLLEIWRAVARTSLQDSRWTWGGLDGSNSISDAEQLLCLLAPATGIPTFRLDQPDETADDVLDALRMMGDSVEIPRLLTRVITEYLEKYTAPDGDPIFAGGGYLSAGAGDPPDETQQQLNVVDSYSASVALMLATIGFVKVFRGVVRREDLRREVDTLEAMASKRLSAAMVGLLRSFSVNGFDAYSAEGQALCRTVNQSGLPDRRIVDELRLALRDINARLRDVTIGSGAGVAEDLDRPNRLFECGWSWGVVKGAPKIETTEDVGPQPEGVAQPAPYLYFTVVALEAIATLFSERTRVLGLLNEEQARLAQALQVRWDLTQSYWSTIATFGSTQWPLEDIPWRTTDDEESDYYTLLVTSIVVQDLVRRRATDAELGRVGDVLGELANRSRITRRAFAQDPAVALHTPGVRMALLGSELGGDTPLRWVASDFAPVLLRRSVTIATLLRDTGQRGRMIGLADRIWEHLDGRRLKAEPGSDLWDQPGSVFPQIIDRYDRPSWYYSRRVVECLTTAADVVVSPPLRSERLANLAADLLSEADHRFDQELLGGSSEAGPAMRASLQSVRSSLQRARTIAGTHPGTAVVLASEVLRELDRLAAARQDVTGAF